MNDISFNHKCLIDRELGITHSYWDSAPVRSPLNPMDAAVTTLFLLSLLVLGNIGAFNLWGWQYVIVLVVAISMIGLLVLYAHVRTSRRVERLARRLQEDHGVPVEESREYIRENLWKITNDV